MRSPEGDVIFSPMLYKQNISNKVIRLNLTTSCLDNLTEDSWISFTK